MAHRLLVVIGIMVAQCARFLGIRHDVTQANLARVFSDQPARFRKKILVGSYSNLGRVFAELLYLRFARPGTIARKIHFKNPEVFLHHLGKGKGVVVVSGHLANWEWMALAAHAHLGIPLSVVIKNNPVRSMERFLQKLRRRTGNALINSADVRGMFRALRDGGCVALLGDQAAPAESTKVFFFNTLVPTFEGPARLALRTRSPLLFAKCMLEPGGSYSLEFFEVPYDDLVADTPEAVRELTQRHTAILEQAIRRHPEQWVWQHRRWKNAE